MTALLAAASHTSACDCFGPDNFCETISPTAFTPPDAVVLAVKQSDVAHGMTVEIVQSFSGPLTVGQTVTVWGDCGALCRLYPGTWNIGDTVVFALLETDFMGNLICSTTLEQPGDYMISICGQYWLSYSGGSVSGPIYPGGGTSVLSMTAFAAMVEQCGGSAGIGSPMAPDPLLVHYEGEVPVIELPDAGPNVMLAVMDAMGRSVLSRSWNGRALRLEGMAQGTYLVQVSSGSSRWLRGVVQR
jgi:hypothetical protein